MTIPDTAVEVEIRDDFNHQHDQTVRTEIEAFRALARYAPGAVSRLPAVLDLIDLDPRIRILAQAVEPATVRSLDAVHLGTALQSRPGLTSFVTYDKRLLDAAQTAGLPVDCPRYRKFLATCGRR